MLEEGQGEWGKERVMGERGGRGDKAEREREEGKKYRGRGRKRRRNKGKCTYVGTVGETQMESNGSNCRDGRRVKRTEKVEEAKQEGCGRLRAGVVCI